MWKWLPIDEIILKNVIAYLPNPIQGQKLRLPKICKKLFTYEKLSKGYSEQEKIEFRHIKEAVENCDNSLNAPVVIYISKMMNIPRENVNEHGLIQIHQASQETKFVGFARIFSGVLKRGSEIFVISSRIKDKK